MKIYMFVVVGDCWLLANIWYFQSFRRALSTSSIPDVISPLQFVGVTDDGGTKGRAMASMLESLRSRTSPELAKRCVPSSKAAVT